MTLKAFSVRDAKTEAFSPPFCLNTIGEAEREFHKNANNKDTKVFHYPEDFDLYYLGDYDDLSGKFMSLDTPQHVIKAVQLKTN